MKRRALLFALAAIGCDHPDLTTVEFTPVTTPPVDVLLSQERIELPAGIAVAVDVKVFDDAGEEVASAKSELVDDVGAVQFLPTKIEDRSILAGDREGEATLSFQADFHDGTLSVPVVVIPQN